MPLELFKTFLEDLKKCPKLVRDVRAGTVVLERFSNFLKSSKMMKNRVLRHAGRHRGAYPMPQERFKTFLEDLKKCPKLVWDVRAGTVVLERFSNFLKSSKMMKNRVP